MTLATALPTGFVILAVRPAADLAALLPPDTAQPGERAVLIGSTAAAWDAFVADLAADPARLTGEPHPFDAWVRRSLGRGDIPPRGRRRAATSGGGVGRSPSMARRRPSAGASSPRAPLEAPTGPTAAACPQRPPFRAWWPCDAHAPLNFLGIARAMGLPGPSPIGLGIHPAWGPWWGIRGLALGAFPDLADTPDRTQPCAACIATHGTPPCAAACPAGVIRPADDGGWRLDGPACARVHLDADTCTHGCAARDACPAGHAHRYPEEAVRYHANRAAGRVALRRRLGLADADDPHEGSGPHWAAWAAAR